MDQESINFDKNLALFYFAYRTFSKTADDLVENYGISKVHRRILFFVARMPGLKVNELLTVLDISKQALNKPMQELLQKEWLLTKPNENDKRSKCIYLTPQGAKIDALISNAQKTKMKEIFQQAGDSAGEAWTKVMAEYAKESGTDFIERIT